MIVFGTSPTRDEEDSWHSGCNCRRRSARRGPSPAADDLTIVSKATRDGGEPTTATSYLSTDRARMVQPDGQEAILDLKTGQITVIDGRKKEYFVVTRQDMEQMKTRIQQTMNSPEMQKAQDQMKNLPPEVQKRMQGMMGAATGSFDVKKAGTTRKIAGYNCDNWTVTLGQFSKTEQCMTTELPVPVQTWDAYRDFAEGMRSMMASMGPMSKGMADIAAKMKEMRGYPLAVSNTSSFMGRSMDLLERSRRGQEGRDPGVGLGSPRRLQEGRQPDAQGGGAPPLGPLTVSRALRALSTADSRPQSQARRSSSPRRGSGAAWRTVSYQASSAS